MMDLVRWNPWGEMEPLRNRMNRFFEGFFLPTMSSETDLSMGAWNPGVDIIDNENNMVIKADLPGVEKENVEVDVKDRVLTIKGERSYENEIKEENFCRKERAYGKFHRSFTLPTDVDPDSIKAEFKDGVLSIEIPKSEEAKPKQISIH